MIPVPASVVPEAFAAVQEQWREHQRHARQSRRGALYLLPGVVQCQQCGYAYNGKRLSPSARKGKPRAYAYYRCLGTDADRFGGERVCHTTQGRTDRLDLAVGREVCALLAHPDRLAEEYRRRRRPNGPGRRHERTTMEAQRGKLRQGVARLIDSYTEGLTEKHAFEPRLARLRQRLAHVEVPCQQLANEEALHTELRLLMGRLEEFAAQIHQRLEHLDWTEKRELIRALVVHVVFRVEPHPGELCLEKKGCKIVGGVLSPLLANIYLHELDRYMEGNHLALTDRERMKRRRNGLANFLYVRYADDFVVLSNGTRAQMEAFRDELYQFLKTTLRLDSGF